MQEKEQANKEFVDIDSRLEDIGAQLQFIAESVLFMDEGPFAVEPGEGSLRGLYCIVRGVEEKAKGLLAAIRAAEGSVDVETEAAAA
jgi:hypothetical protein